MSSSVLSRSEYDIFSWILHAIVNRPPTTGKSTTESIAIVWDDIDGVMVFTILLLVMRELLIFLFGWRVALKYIASPELSVSVDADVVVLV